MRTQTTYVLGAYPRHRVARTAGVEDTKITFSDGDSSFEINVSQYTLSSIIKELQWAKRMIKEGN